ncbi:hypothetical protein CRYUN_Cryun01aG0128900 [Craigia yunnanensis]
MGRQGGDPTVVSSSIALLQQRFRQLQKVREKREEKELLKLFSESERASPTMRYKPNRLSFQPEVILPYRQLHQYSLSLGLNSHSRQTDSELWQSQHQRTYGLITVPPLQAHQIFLRILMLILLFICRGS